MSSDTHEAEAVEASEDDPSTIDHPWLPVEHIHEFDGFVAEELYTKVSAGRVCTTVLMPGQDREF